MDWGLLQSTKQNYSFPPIPHPPPILLTPPPPPLLAQSNVINKTSPSILLIIAVLAVIFFISGLLHLLIRYLLQTTNRDPEDLENVTVLQGQLQQLFHLHDSGVDQSFIDTLPLFLYKAIIGLKDPFDCAVCLCEFEADDKLRLLPKCSHAFHLECIDTWLLSHSTCPLCRRSLLPDYSPNCSPIVLVLESGSDSSREILSDRGESVPNAHLGFLGEDDFRHSCNDISQKIMDSGAKEETGSATLVVSEAKVVPVKLGKFRNVDVAAGGAEGSSSSNVNLDERRCFSMGSFEYVMDESSLLQVAVKPPTKKKPSVKKPGHRLTVSEYDCYSRREGFKEFEPSKSSELRDDGGSASISGHPHRRESFSVSKIWLRPKKDKPIAEDCSRRASSFRLPLYRGASNESKLNCSSSPRTVSEVDITGWEKSGSELSLDVEAGSHSNRIGSRADEAPSFARRTLLWLAGWQNR